MRAADLRKDPTAAHAEFLQLYAHLELTFGAPPVNLSGLLQPADWVRPACPSGFPDWHLDNDDGDTSLSNIPNAQQNAAGGAPDGNLNPPVLPTLMRF
eukprot:3950088-Pyramimonas_sp.AAC.1